MPQRVTRRAAMAGGAALLAAAPRAGAAQGGWPERAVTIVVCFPPGGATDILARIVAQPLGEALGKPVVVENRGGAGGNIGMGYVARQAPDGYTLLATSSAYVVNPSLYPNTPYDPFRDFAPISELGAAPNVIAVRPDSPFASVADIIAHARANPGKLNFTTSGVGTTPHLAGEVFKLRTGIEMEHVPFSGAGPATQAVLAGTVPIYFTAFGSIGQQVRAGQLRVLAQTGAQRMEDLSDVPTLGELGIRDAVSETFLALFAVAGTPQPILDRLANEVEAILRRPAIRERFRQTGTPVTGGGPAALRARVEREVPMWREVIRQAGIRIG
jgi:tripartite-type tricarboxylate transporter receptor subunit TctC